MPRKGGRICLARPLRCSSGLGPQGPLNCILLAFVFARFDRSQWVGTASPVGRERSVTRRRPDRRSPTTAARRKGAIRCCVGAVPNDRLVPGRVSLLAGDHRQLPLHSSRPSRRAGCQQRVVFRRSNGIPDRWRSRPYGRKERTVLVEFDVLEQSLAVHDSADYPVSLAALGNGAVRDLRIVEAV